MAAHSPDTLLAPDELAAWLRLLLTPGVGRASARRLLAALGGAPQIWAPGAQGRWAGLVGPTQAQALQAWPARFDQQWAATQHWLDHAEPGQVHALLPLGHGQYPSSLLQTEDPPLLLFVQGSAACMGPDRPWFPFPQSLAVVGSRNPTAQGRSLARDMARALADAGLCIVSGLAQGVDAAAHEGALDAARATGTGWQAATIAVVGTGLDQVYPPSHAALAGRIAGQGMIVSEYPLGSPPLAAHFPQRNRIIAGLSQGTLVVEAALRSGSLITARLAAEQGREVFAIPGSIHAPQSRGCHALLRQGAKLVETVQDVLDELQGVAAPVLTAAARPAPAIGIPPATQERDPLLRVLGQDPLSLDGLMDRTGMDAASLQARLLELELDGQVQRLPGGLYQRLGRA
jgi:DNA processing protein